MIKNLGKLFRQKKEESMQERAERSRRTKEIEDEFEKTTRNLETLLNEISQKKKNG